MEMTIGGGMVFVGGVERDGMKGILFRQMDEPHQINSIDPNWKDGDAYTPNERDVVLWVESLESARVIQDRVNSLCLMLNGFAVADNSSNKTVEPR